MKKVICPPCGAEFKSHNDDELVEVVQQDAKTFHQHDITRDRILKEAVVIGQEPVLRTVACPCGSEFKTHDENELVELVQKHAATAHSKALSREEILKATKVV